MLVVSAVKVSKAGALYGVSGKDFFRKPIVDSTYQRSPSVCENR